MDSTSATLTVAADAPTQSMTVASSPAVIQIIAVPAEPEVGGDTAHGGGFGLSMSLSLDL